MSASEKLSKMLTGSADFRAIFNKGKIFTEGYREAVVSKFSTDITDIVKIAADNRIPHVVFIHQPLLLLNDKKLYRLHDKTKKNELIKKLSHKEAFNTEDIAFILQTDFFNAMNSIVEENKINQFVTVLPFAELLANLNDEDYSSLFFDQVHLTPKGNKLLAKTIYEKIFTEFVDD